MKSTPDYQKEAVAFLDKINDIRQNPVKYSLDLEKFRSCYKGKNFALEKNSQMPTQEGVSALNELIAFCEKQKPRNELNSENGLNLTLKEFCESVKGSEALNDAYTDFDSEKIGSKYGSYGKSGRIQVYMMNLISENFEKNVLLLLLCDGDDSRQIRDLVFDGKFSKIGLFIKKYPKEDSPMLTILLAEEYKTKAQYAEAEEEPAKAYVGSDSIRKNKAQEEELVSGTSKLNLGKKPSAKQQKQEDEDDPDLDLPEGVVKIERKCKTIKENGKEFVVTKTITYMEDGSENTEITKARRN